jgi:23S rRNA pseudouridine2457 synthase
MAVLRKGVFTQGRKTRPCKARLLEDPGYPPRSVPIRFRLSVPTSWIEITLIEGKNRQVRKMTAVAGFPTLRLIRVAVNRLELGDLPIGKWRELGDKERDILLKS